MHQFHSRIFIDLKPNYFNFVFASRFYWLVNLNSTMVFLGIAYIQQSVAKNLGFLIPFTSVLLALIAIHMTRNKLTYKPKKGKIQINISINMSQKIPRKRLSCLYLRHRWITIDHAWGFLEFFQNVLPPPSAPEWRCDMLVGPS